MAYKHYSVEDDKRTIAFWMIGGGMLLSVVIMTPVFLIISVVITSVILRGLENIDAKRPVFMPGKYERHFRESFDRAVSKDPYRGGYRKRIKKSHYY